MEQKVIDNNNRPSDEIIIRELILKILEWYRYLLSKWLTILICGILGGILGFTYSMFKKPVYTASTTFVLEDGDKAGGLAGQYAGIASMVGIDIGSGGGGGIFQGDNILELYRSRTMIEKALLATVSNDGKRQILIDRYIEFNELRKEWAKKPKLKNIKFTLKEFEDKKFSRLQDSILGTIVKDINKNNLNVIRTDKKLNIIKAEVRAEDEFFAKAFNEQIVENVNDFYIQTKTKKSLESIEILQQKTDSVRAVMNGAIYSAAAVTDATPNLNITRQVQRIAPVQRSQFNLESNKAMLSELIKNLELSKISLRKETPLFQIIDGPIYPLETTKFGKAKGIFFGGVIAGFLTVLYLLARKLLNDILKPV